jgi:hypothetical protein
LIGGKGKFTRSLQTCIITAASLLLEVQRASSMSCLAVVAKEGWVGLEIRQDRCSVGVFLFVCLFVIVCVEPAGGWYE